MSLAELNPECHQYLRLQKNLFLDPTSRGHQHSFPNFSSNSIKFHRIFFFQISSFQNVSIVYLSFLSRHSGLRSLDVLLSLGKIPGSSLQVRILCWIVPAKLLSHEGTIFTCEGWLLSVPWGGQGRGCASSCCPALEQSWRTWPTSEQLDPPDPVISQLSLCRHFVSMRQKFPIGICSWWSWTQLSLPMPGRCRWLPRGWYQKTGTCLSAGLMPC